MCISPSLDSCSRWRIEHYPWRHIRISRRELPLEGRSSSLSIVGTRTPDIDAFCSEILAVVSGRIDRACVPNANDDYMDHQLRAVEYASIL